MESLAFRSVAAWITARTGAYRALQWACGRLAGGFILAYHALPATRFERQVEALKPNEPVHLSELFQRLRAGRNTAGLFAITFDDGVAATVREIGHVCASRHWPVTFYLPTAYLDERHGMPFQQWLKVVNHIPRSVLSLPSGILDLSTGETLERFKREIDARFYTQPRDRYQPLIDELVRWVLDHGEATSEQLRPPEPISWSEVTRLSRNDAIRFESHGVTHTAVVALSRAALEEELKTSQRRISEHTNRSCRHFCYPYGEPESVGAIAPDIVAQVYDTAVTMSRGRLGRSPLSLVPRIPMYERDHPDVARLKIVAL